MITYNHEKYIREATLSLLDQTFTDFELIVVNDGSTDGTAAVLEAIHDPRIHLITQENQGPNAAINAGIASARGQYIALMSGDDVCDHRRLERQLAFAASSGAKVVCTWIEMIDDDSAPYHGKPQLLQHCNREARPSQAEILRTLFFEGNYLWPSSALIETEILRAVGGCCLTSLQLSDFILWIALIKRTQIHTLHEPLLKYRVRANDVNLSHDPGNFPRAYFEREQIYRTSFDDVPELLFREAFAAELRDPSFTGAQALALERAFIYGKHALPAIRRIGLEKLYVLLQDPEIVRCARERYHFGLPDYYRMTNEQP